VPTPQLTKPRTGAGRFQVLPHAEEVYTVQDLDARRYNLPERAVNLHLRYDAAVKIAEILNEEWGYFLRYPS